jgi:hypothetical protein
MTARALVAFFMARVTFFTRPLSVVSFAPFMKSIVSTGCRGELSYVPLLPDWTFLAPHRANYVLIIPGSKFVPPSLERQKIDLKPLQSGLDRLVSATDNAVIISNRSIGKIHTGRQRRALAVFSKLIVHNMAIVGVAGKFLEDTRADGILDHFSIATLARASIDTALMSMYISEPTLTLDRWDFRRQLLFLHDVNNRSRFLKPLRKNGVELGFFENYEEIRKGIQDRIRVLGASLLYSEEKIAEYERGYHLFVDGIRGAVREAGWDVDAFDFNQSYLSAYVHCHPVSFMRIDEHKISFSGASKFQVDFCQYVLGMTAEITRSVVDRMKGFSVPGTGDPNDHLE